MFSINNTYTYELEVNKSRFIGIIFKINSIDEFNLKLDSIKKDYPKATHYCYAYRLIDYYKSSDDGEPSSTAGAPIFNVIDNNHLYNTGIVVVRYFGGVKLGAGGLVRAYTKTASNLVLNEHLNKLIEAYELSITFDYDNLKSIDNILSKCNYKLLNKEFLDNITYHIILYKNDIDKIHNYTYEIIKDTMLEINN